MKVIVTYMVLETLVIILPVLFLWMPGKSSWPLYQELYIHCIIDIFVLHGYCGFYSIQILPFLNGCYDSQRQFCGYILSTRVEYHGLQFQFRTRSFCFYTFSPFIPSHILCIFVSFEYLISDYVREEGEKERRKINIKKTFSVLQNSIQRCYIHQYLPTSPTPTIQKCIFKMLLLALYFKHQEQYYDL